MSLTKKQKLVFDFICEYIDQNDYSPTQVEIQSHFGFKSLGSVQDYIKYLTNAGYLQSDSNAVRGLTPVRDDQVADNHTEIPLLGDVAAGIPIEAMENPQQIAVPNTMLGSGSHYALNVCGNSMIDDGILDGDVIVVKKQNDASNGQTVVAVVNNEATVKRFYNKKSHVELHPANSTMKPFIIQDESFEIKGVLVGLLRVY
jgi:repressor LexA